MNSAPLQSSAGTYVYCIVQDEPFRAGHYAFQSKGIGGRGDPVYTVSFMNLAAVVSDSHAARYDIGRENTLTHEIVIEEAMARSDVLPVRFGTVAKSVQKVEEMLLKRKFGELCHLMTYVQGRVELGLKVFWNRETLFGEIGAEDKRIRKLKEEIASRPAGETYYERIQLGQLIEQALGQKRDDEAWTLLEQFRPLAVETKVNKVLTDMMVLNASFLVDRDNEPAFDAKVAELDAANCGSRIIKYAGPLPPFNFVNLVMHWEE